MNAQDEFREDFTVALARIEAKLDLHLVQQGINIPALEPEGSEEWSADHLIMLGRILGHLEALNDRLSATGGRLDRMAAKPDVHQVTGDLMSVRTGTKRRRWWRP